MKRIFTLGISTVFLVASLAGCADRPSQIGRSKAGNLTNNQALHEDFVASNVLIMFGCSQKLGIPIKDPSLYQEKETFAMKACVEQQRGLIGQAMQDGLASGEIQPSKAGGFALDRAVAFARSSSEGARQMDPQQLVKEARQKGWQLRPFNPE